MNVNCNKLIQEYECNKIEDKTLAELIKKEKDKLFIIYTNQASEFITLNTFILYNKQYRKLIKLNYKTYCLVIKLKEVNLIFNYCELKNENLLTINIITLKHLMDLSYSMIFNIFDKIIDFPVFQDNHLNSIINFKIPNLIKNLFKFKRNKFLYAKNNFECEKNTTKFIDIYLERVLNNKITDTFINKYIICDLDRKDVDLNQTIVILILLFSMINDKEKTKYLYQTIKQIVSFYFKYISHNENEILNFLKLINLEVISIKYFPNIFNVYEDKITCSKLQYNTKLNNYNCIFSIHMRDLKYIFDDHFLSSKFKNSLVDFDDSIELTRDNKILFNYQNLDKFVSRLLIIKIKNSITNFNMKYNLNVIGNELINKLNLQLNGLHSKYLNDIEDSKLTKIIKNNAQKIKNEKYLNYIIKSTLNVVNDINYNLVENINNDLIKYLIKLYDNYYNLKRKEPEIILEHNQIDHIVLDYSLDIEYIIFSQSPKCIQNLYNKLIDSHDHLHYSDRFKLAVYIKNLFLSDENKLNLWYEIFKQCKDKKMTELTTISKEKFYNCKYGRQFLLIINSDNVYPPHSCNTLTNYCSFMDIEEINKEKCTKHLNSIAKHLFNKQTTRNIISPNSYYSKIIFLSQNSKKIK